MQSIVKLGLLLGALGLLSACGGSKSTPTPVPPVSSSSVSSVSSVESSSSSSEPSSSSSSEPSSSSSSAPSSSSSSVAPLVVTAAAGEGGSINPPSQSVEPGDVVVLTLAANAGYELAAVQGCNGSLNGNQYTTAPVEASCTVEASFNRLVYRVRAMAGTGGGISPASLQVYHGSTVSFTVTASAGYQIDQVTGCGGSLNGSTYRTAAITSACTVNASFVLDGLEAPQNLAAEPGDGDITLSWSNVVNAEGYHLYYATETGITSNDYASFTGGTWVQDVSSPFLLSGLTNGTRYYLVVTAFNAGGESDASDPVDAMPVLPANVPTGLLNDTGIDWCANETTNNLPCPVAGFAGQDGEHGRDAQARAGTLTKVGAGAAGFDYTKLDANGNALAASANTWSCVRDNHTRLIWEVKTNDGGLRDMYHTYSWYNPNNSTNGGHAGVQNGGTCSGSACDTHAYAQAVNAQGLCGANDWRLPSRNELRSLVHRGRVNPAIDTAYFPNTPSNWFWSSSPYANYSDSAWSILFYYGDGGILYKSNGHQVRLVRSGQ
jgi:hypothetical protein